MNILKNTSKVILTCLVVASIAWGFLALNEQRAPSPIKTAEADVSFFNFAPTTKHDRFVQTLKEEGFEEPREYDWNGNKFYFTLKHDSKSPVDMMRNMQHAFVRNKVNDKAHLFKPEAVDFAYISDGDKLSALADAADRQKFTPGQERFVRTTAQQIAPVTDYFNGGIIPFKVEDNYVGMRGVELKKKTKDGNIVDVFKQMTKGIAKGQKIDEQVSRFYNMEAFKPKGSPKTTMTAMWSQADIDMSKYNAKQDPRVEANHTIPSCGGCIRTMDFRGQGVEASYANNMFMSKNINPAASQRFYSIELARKGWKQSEATHLLRELYRKGEIPVGANVQSYAKGKDFITVVSHRSDIYKGMSVVQVLESL